MAQKSPLSSLQLSLLPLPDFSSFTFGSFPILFSWVPLHLSYKQRDFDRLWHSTVLHSDSPAPLCVLGWSLGKLFKDNGTVLQSPEAPSPASGMKYKKKRTSSYFPESLKALLTWIQSPSSSVWLLLVSFASYITIPSLLIHGYSLLGVLRLLPQPLPLPPDPRLVGYHSFSGLLTMETFHSTSKGVSAHHSLASTSVKTWCRSCTKSAPATITYTAFCYLWDPSAVPIVKC